MTSTRGLSSAQSDQIVITTSQVKENPDKAIEDTTAHRMIQHFRKDSASNSCDSDHVTFKVNKDLAMSK